MSNVTESRGWAWLATTVIIPIMGIALPLIFTLLGFIIMHLHGECMTAVAEEKQNREKVETRVMLVEQSNENNKQHLATLDAQSGYIKQLLEEVRKDIAYIKDNMKKP